MSLQEQINKLAEKYANHLETSNERNGKLQEVRRSRSNSARISGQFPVDNSFLSPLQHPRDIPKSITITGGTVESDIPSPQLIRPSYGRLPPSHRPNPWCENIFAFRIFRN